MIGRSGSQRFQEAGDLVLTRVLRRRVPRIVELDGCRDERTQRERRGHVERCEQSLPRSEIGAVEDAGHDLGVEPAQVLDDEIVLDGEDGVGGEPGVVLGVDLGDDGLVVFVGDLDPS